MLSDARTTFGLPVALHTGGTGTQVIGDQIDLRVAGIDQGVGYPLYWYLATSAAAASGGAATVTFQLVTADNAALTTNPVVIQQTAAFPVANLGAGRFLYAGSIPFGLYSRYMGMRQVTGTAALTTGSVFSYLTQEPDRWRPFNTGAS